VSLHGEALRIGASFSSCPINCDVHPRHSVRSRICARKASTENVVSSRGRQRRLCQESRQRRRPPPRRRPSHCGRADSGATLRAFRMSDAGLVNPPTNAGHRCWQSQLQEVGHGDGRTAGFNRMAGGPVPAWSRREADLPGRRPAPFFTRRIDVSATSDYRKCCDHRWKPQRRSPPVLKRRRQGCGAPTGRQAVPL
jgi:hypothetical protein